MDDVWWLFAAFALLFGLAWLARRLLPDTPAAREPHAEAHPETPDDVDEIAAIGDELDLHGVSPREIAELVDAFIEVARAEGRRHVRIIHGKGIGVAREQVRVRLQRNPAVHAFGDAPPPSAWGATVVELCEPGCAVDHDRASD